MKRRERLEQKQAYCKNEAKKNRRISQHSLDPDNQRIYAHRAEAFEQKTIKVKKSLAKSAESGIIRLPDTLQLEDIEIFRTLSSRARNFDVMDLITGDIYHIAEGTKIQNVQVFAGKGTRVKFRNSEKYAERYGGDPLDWQHVKGFCELVTFDGNQKAEIHWVQCEGIGKKEFFVKRWFE